jgi:NhaA family Na+:H+ antiporter
VSVVRRFLPDPEPGEARFLVGLLRQESVGGLLALAAAALAVLWANSPWDGGYRTFAHLDLGPLDLEHWASDGALAIFFFVAGLEVKREFVVGSLRKPADALVPVTAAVCGVVVPILVFVAINVTHPDGHPGGWAIPAATDIAFALAVLAVVGSHLPTALRAFLLTLAVVDDLIVIAVIAVFFAGSIHLGPLLLAGVGAAVWLVLQQQRLSSPWIYVPLAVATWWFTHESGVHATIAGVVLGLLTRVRPDPDEAQSPAEHLEHLLAPLSAGLAVPFFALMSAGVPLSGGTALARDPVVLGVVVGLVLGKPVGVLGGTLLVTRLTRAELNPDITWRQLSGVALLAGIGFTVSLLVSDLSFTGAERDAAKAAVLAASVLAAVVGALTLRSARASTPTGRRTS